jgi:hypothetical protein
MTDKEKLLRIKKLADEMYRAAQYLTTDASHLHKAMDEYHQFIVHDYHKEEPVSEDLGEYINELSKQFPEVSFAKLSRIAIRVVKWQKAKDQETIETAIHHAYHNGRLEMKEQMMTKAIETTFNVSLPSSLYDKLWVKGCKEGDKLLVIKKDEL